MEKAWHSLTVHTYQFSLRYFNKTPNSPPNDLNFSLHTPLDLPETEQQYAVLNNKILAKIWVNGNPVKAELMNR